MNTIWVLLGVIVIAVMTVVYFVKKGRRISEDKTLMPQPGSFDAERDARFRRYDEDQQ